MEERTFVPSAVADTVSVTGAAATDQVASDSASTRSFRLSNREREIVDGLLAYRSLSEIAVGLGISVHTARNHLKSVFHKTRVSSQRELLQLVAGSAPGWPRKSA